ncbi:MAG: CopG family transcriptional regulator [Anaerolineales bacterium]|nr:CopG family transcriptional regulator [Anaerolineales bacterium]MCA9932156.1 CopG family transcriptional regulator [Anaerolineales bacterium]
MITLRLDPKLEQAINNIALQMGVSKSELIRRSVIEFIDKLETPSPWDLGSDVFGKYASGQDNLSRDRKALVKEKIRAKK